MRVRPEGGEGRGSDEQDRGVDDEGDEEREPRLERHVQARVLHRLLVRVHLSVAEVLVGLATDTPVSFS